MKIYDIKDVVLNKCEIDLSEYVSLDEYFLKNPLLKKLVYSYLKEAKQKTKLSYLDKLFKNTLSLESFNSKSNKWYFNNDEIYRNIFNKYIKYPEIWLFGTNQLHSFYFDNKYLLNGKYQIFANKAIDKANSIVNTNYVADLNQIRGFNQTKLSFFDEWFDKKRKIERSFFENLLSKFNFEPHLKVRFYWKYIEIYDSVTTLTFQIEIKSFMNSSVKVFMESSVKRSSYGRRNTLAFKFLVKNKSVSDLYSYIVSSVNIDEINKFVEEIDSLETDKRYEVFHASVYNILEDLRERHLASNFDEEYVKLYLIQYNSVETNTIHFSHTNKLLRYYRTIKNQDGTELKLSSYNLPKNLDKAAKHLVMSGFVNISPQDEEFDLQEMLFVSTDKIEGYNAIQFLRTPIINLVEEMRQVGDYLQQFEIEISDLKSKGNPIDYLDTRVWIENTKNSEYSKNKINTYFDLQLFEKNKTKYVDQLHEQTNNFNERKLNFKNKFGHLNLAIDKILENDKH